MMKLSSILPITIVVGSLTLASAAESPNTSSAQGEAKSLPDEPLQYETDVRPIMKAMCFQCHGIDLDVHDWRTNPDRHV